MWSNFIEQLNSIKSGVGSYLYNKPLSGCLWFILSLFVALLLVMAIWADISPQWVGFGAYDEVKQGARAKTLWDWMELLIVPTTLAAGAFLLGKWQADNERKSTQDNQRQILLDSYIDKMADLLLDKQLRSPNNEVQSIARTITLALFRQLDGHRKGNALQFLFESGLVNDPEPVVKVIGLNLNGANLSGASLIGVNLAGTRCTKVKLNNAKLIGSNLTGCNFSDSDLQGVDFSNASLDQAILTNCNLLEADFSGADLSMADFTSALVTLDQLKRAKSLEYAILPNGNVHRMQQEGVNYE